MFASLKRYIDFARSSDARLPRMVAEIDVTASQIKRLVPSLANFLKRSIDRLLILCEPKNGKHKNLSLFKNVMILNKTLKISSQYAIKFSTKNYPNLQKKCRHIYQ